MSFEGAHPSPVPKTLLRCRYRQGGQRARHLYLHQDGFKDPPDDPLGQKALILVSNRRDRSPHHHKSPRLCSCRLSHHPPRFPLYLRKYRHHRSTHLRRRHLRLRLCTGALLLNLRLLGRQCRCLCQTRLGKSVTLACQFSLGITRLDPISDLRDGGHPPLKTFPLLQKSLRFSDEPQLACLETLGRWPCGS